MTTTQSSIQEQLVLLLTSPLADAQYELVDVVTSSLGTPAATVEVFIDNSLDHPLGGRIDLDGVSTATRIIDAVLEVADPITGAFTLEVSSPGLERALRTPGHFGRFVGTTVSVKTHPGTTAERRIEGILSSADPDTVGSVMVGGVTIPYAAIERARTVFTWGPQAKPGAGPSKSAAKRASKVSPTGTGSAGSGLRTAPTESAAAAGPTGSDCESDVPTAVPDKQTQAPAGVDHDEE